MATSIQVAIDCADPAKPAGFWALALGYKVQDPPGGFESWPALVPVAGPTRVRHRRRRRDRPLDPPRDRLASTRDQ